MKIVFRSYSVMRPKLNSQWGNRNTDYFMMKIASSLLDTFQKLKLSTAISVALDTNKSLVFTLYK